MIEYYLAVLIFLLVIVSIGYFMYRWKNVIVNVNETPLNSTTNYDSSGNNNIITTIAKVDLHQPCVVTTDRTNYDGSVPICDDTKGLMCVTGLYEGNDDNSSGVCLSKVGSFCNTIYDCEPNATMCIKNICERSSETINLPCKFDSDCIGELTCKNCKAGVGKCINSDGICIEANANRECPDGYNECSDKEFRFNHICDKDLVNPVCKYNISPKDQGCFRDSDCAAFGGESFCFLGDFKTLYNPNGVIKVPSYRVSKVSVVEETFTVLEVDFGDRLLTSESFLIGTEVNFVKGGITTSRSTISVGPYYIRKISNNNKFVLGSTKLEPDPTKNVDVPTNLIELDEDEYKYPDNFVFDNSDIMGNPGDYSVVFGLLPPMVILSKCYYDTTNQNFKLIDDDQNFKLTTDIVEPGTTEVRFNDKNIEGFIGNAISLTLNQILDQGKSFTIFEDISSLISFNSSSNPLQVMFGRRIGTNLLNKEKGVCVAKLPPSANIQDSKYNIEDYNQGNPCITQFDGEFNVELIDNFCKFKDKSTGIGSLCQFKREDYDPLPCDTTITRVVDGLTYNLECLINDDLTGYIRNNVNFLNSSFAGVCSFPVNRKYKSCDYYSNNCRPPYVCSEINNGTFCDSRFDILQCNINYSCPPRYQCSDGLCLGISNNGICVDGSECFNKNCGTTLSLKYHDSISYLDNASVDEIKDVNLDLTGFTKVSSLYIKSIFENDERVTYCFIHENTNYKFFTISGFNSPTLTIAPLTVSISVGDSDVFKFIIDSGKIYLVQNKNVIYPTENKPSLNLGTDKIAFDYLNRNTVYVVEDESPQLNDTRRPYFYIHGKGNQEKNYSLYYNNKRYPIPHYLNTSTELIDVKFDLKNLNNYIDVTTIYKPSSNNLTERDNIIGLRHKVFPCTDFKISGKQVLSPKIKIKTPNFIENEYEYFVDDPIDINTLMTFSGYKICLDPITIDNTIDVSLTNKTTIYPIKYILYNNGVLSFKINKNITTITDFKGYANIQLMEDPQFLPYNIFSTDYKNNFNNSLSPAIVYPTWIEDLNDLIVGDSYYPKMLHVYYEPNLVTKNFYLPLDMYTDYQDEEENQIVRQQAENQRYMFKFSSSKAQLDLINNQTLPIRISKNENFGRFAVCNETDNLFFLTYRCL